MRTIGQIIHDKLFGFLAKQGLILGIISIGGSAPDPNPGMIANADATAALGNRQLDLAEEQWGFTKDEYAKLSPVFQEIMQTNLDSMKSNAERADEYADYEKSTFRPLEQKLVEQASQFDTPGKREELAQQASADIGTAYGNLQGQLTRSLGKYGINPNSNRFAALNAGLMRDEALQKAGAMTGSRQQSMDLGTAKMYDAAALGRGLATNASTAYGVSMNSGNAAGNAAMQPGQVMQSGYGQVGQQYGRAGQSYASSTNQYGADFDARMAGWQGQQQSTAGMLQGVGSIAGMMMMSSKDSKDEKEPVDDEAVLKKVKGLNVESWKYKGDDKRRIGPYAEDMNKKFGDGVAPEGEMLDPVSMHGLTLSAIKALAKKVENLEKPKKMKSGGAIRGPGGPKEDKIPAMLSNGEYVVPAAVVKKMGVKHFDEMIAKHGDRGNKAALKARKGIRGR
jgi:hypothetical protein